METAVSVPNRGRFEGKSIIVTGAASGIGRETALHFAREGGRVVVADINAEGATQTVSAIEALGGVARVSVTDVSDAASVEAMVTDTMVAYGRLDVLHNNAYWAPLHTTLVDTTTEQWERTIGVTLTSVYVGCKFAIPHMIAGGGGAIVNTASTSALVASPAFAAYAGAKAGVLGLTRSVAFDFGNQGIRCNAVCPGLIKTPATVPVFADPERVEWLTSKILVGRVGKSGRHRKRRSLPGQ